MVGTLVTTANTLRTARRLQTRTRLAAQSCRISRQALLILLLVGGLDIVWPWAAPLRTLFLIAWLAGIVVVGVRAYRRYGVRSMDPARPEVWSAQTAREIERQRPDLDNALIHAVQFGNALEVADPTAAALMRRELARAEQQAATLQTDAFVERAPFVRERRLLLFVLGFYLLIAVISPRAYRFELPRLFAPWSDAPPFSLTDFEVTPANAQVHSGDELLVTVKVSGLMPHRLELMAGTGATGQPLLLSESEPGVYTARMESLTHDTWYYAGADTGRSRRYTVQVSQEPLVRKLTVTYHPPTYTHRPPVTEDLTPQPEIKGLPGARVELEVEADRPLAGGTLAITRIGMSALNLSLAPRPGMTNRAVAAFAVERDGDFNITLTGTPAEGSLQKHNAAAGKITLLHDQTPQVIITAPGRNVIARQDMVVPLRVEAEDDIAVKRLEMHQIFNRGSDTARTIDVPGENREFVYTDRFDLKALHTKPGDVLEYYATVYDNDPTGVHNSDSDRYWIWVVSDEDYAKILKEQRTPSKMTAQYRDLAETAQQLAQDQDQLARDMAAHAERARTADPRDAAAQAKLKAEAEALQKRQQELAARAQDLARQMRELTKQTPQFDIERGLQQKMAQMAQAIERAQQSMQSALQAGTPGQKAQNAASAAQQLQQAAHGGKQVAKVTEAMQNLRALYQDVARLRALTKQQRQIAQQVQQVQQGLKDSKPDAFAQSRLKSLADQQARNRDMLDQVQQDLRQHAQDCQSIAPNAAQTANQVADAIGKMQVPRFMQDAQQALTSQDAPTGASQADAAAKALESLFQAGKKAQGQANSSLDGLALGELGMGAGNTLEQMMQGEGQGEGSQSGQNGDGESGDSGYSAPQPGSRPGDSPNGQNGRQQAQALSLSQAFSGGHKPQKIKEGGPRAPVDASLSGKNVESVSAPPNPPSKATDKDASRTPAEYRRLVQDYFKSVSGNK